MRVWQHYLGFQGLGFRVPATNARTVDGLVVVLAQQLRLPGVSLVSQVRPGGVADAGRDARVQQRLQGLRVHN